MKKIIYTLLFLSIILINNVFSQNEYFQGSVKVDLTTSGPQMVFMMKLTSPNPSKTLGFTVIEFYPTYSNTYALTFGTPVVNTTNFPSLTITYGGQNPWGSESGKTIEQFFYSGSGTTAQTYNVGQEYELFRVPISTASVDFGNLNLEYDGSGYLAYLVLTDLVGTGWTAVDKLATAPVFYGPGTYSGSNGDVVAGGGSCTYSIFDKPFVPMVLWQSAAWTGGTGTGNQPGAGDAAKKCYVRDLNGSLTQASAAVLNLIINTGANLSIQPGGSLTANGPTTITDANAFTVVATNSGVGSFIDNGTINYGASGSAKVQTYIRNIAAPGAFYAHLVGPTVNDPAFQTTNGYTGVYLQAFDLIGLGTYAYQYSEPTNSWANIFELLTPVKTTKGIMLSTVDATNHTLNMTGKLLTGAITSAPLQHGGTNNLDLLSNPYPSALDFSLFYAVNAAGISNKYQVYNPATGTYQFFITTGGGTLTKDIQVGQGFFVETLNTNPATFNNTMRVHSTAGFLKDSYANQLRLNLNGNGYEDATFIYFKDEGTWGYDEMHDVYKWWSMQSDASEIWTVANDNAMLSMNSLPTLGNGMVSVQMNFKCGAAGTYSISAENIGSFEAGTEIYLEDIVAGGEWYNLVENPVYEFTGDPSEIQNRFIIHFFGPTGIEDPTSASAVRIYGYGQEAYIVNSGKETIKNYTAYDMMGRELHSGTLPNNSVNRVWVSNVSGNYIMKVSTKEGRIYTDKVYITK